MSSSRLRLAEAERWDLADRAATAQGAGRQGLARLSAELDIPVTTLRRWARVARQFSPDSRESTLTFSHFEAVIGHSNRIDLLKLAAAEQWSAKQLRRELIERRLVEEGASEDTGPAGAGPAVLQTALEYMNQLASLSSGLRASLRGGVREKVHAVASAATRLDKAWDT